MGEHKSDHNYLIKQSTSPLSSDWSPEEEMKLLDAASECGFGNWSNISYLVGKDSSKCKNHFLEFHINQSDTKILDGKINLIPAVPSIQNVIRPVPGSFEFRDMSGYNAYRSEFSHEYLNDAESILKDVMLHPLEGEENNDESKDLDLFRDMVCTLIDIYRRELSYRAEMKRIVREHGLIDIPKYSAMIMPYTSILANFSPLFPILPRLLSQQEMFTLLESLSLEENLKTRIQEFKEYRVNGLTRLTQVSIYKECKKRRELSMKKKHKVNLGDELKDIRQLHLCPPGTIARKSVPLDITGKPYFNNLNSEEKILASTLRIIPANFIIVKNGLIKECNNKRGLSLGNARSLFQLDVNKIRRIYDYLMASNLIYKPS